MTGRTALSNAALRAPAPPSAAFSTIGAWCSVAILLLFSLLSITDRQIIALLVEPIKQDLGLSDTQLGLLQGLAFALMYSIAGLPIGWAVDRYSRRWIIYLGITVWSLSAAYCGLARNFWQMFIGRSLVGVGEASVAPVAVSLISDLFPPHKVGAPLGVYAAGFPIGNGVALLIGGLVVGLFAGQAAVAFPLVGTVAPWQAVFLVTGLPGVLIALLAFALREPPRNRPTPSRSEKTKAREDDIRSFLANRAKVIAFTFIGFSMSTLVSYSIGGWTPTYLSRSFGWGAERIGASFGLAIAVPGILGSLLGGLLIDRVYRSGVRDASLVVPATCAAICMPFLVGAYFIPDPILMLACLALGLLFFSTAGPASYATWQMIAPPHLRGRLTSGFVFVASLTGTSVGPVAVGFTTDFVFGDEAMVGMSIALVLAIVLPLMVVLLLAGRASLRAVPGNGDSQPE